jgi:glycosyltransferase involved in cell wall biosynthesis
MKIVVVHQYYIMPGRAGGSRFNEFARLWTEAGHHVSVVCGALDYSTGEIPAPYQGRWITREKDGGVDVYRCYVPHTYSKGYAGRAFAFFGFVLSSSTTVALLRDADVVIATSPPLTAAVTGFLLARARLRRRVPWVFEMRDLWPESAITTGVLRKDAPLTKVLYAVEKWACRSADRVNVLTPAFRTDLLDRRLAPDSKIVFIPNGADIEMFKPGPRDNEVRRQYGWGDRTVVMYAGAHGLANALHQMIDAAEQLRDRRDILIAFVGDGPKRAELEADAKKRGLGNVMFCGSQPKSRMADFVNACDVGAAVLQDNPTFRTVYPNKVFDYMSCERPVLLGIDGVARELVVDQAHAGVFTQPENATQLAQAIRALADDPAERAQLGRNGRAWVVANATREALAARYLRVLEELVSGTS